MHHLKEPIKTGPRRHSLSLSFPCVDFPSLSYTKNSQRCSAYGFITFSSSFRNAISEILRKGTHTYMYIHIGNKMLEGDADYDRPCIFQTWNIVKGVEMYAKFSCTQAIGRRLLGM